MAELNNMKNTIIKIMAVLVLVVGAISAVSIFGTSFGPKPKLKADTRINYEYRSTSPDGSRTLLYAKSVRIEKANGDWQEDITYLKADGSPEYTITTLAIANRGVFRVNDGGQALLFMGSKPDKVPARSDIEKSKGLGLREDTHLGEKVVAGKVGNTDVAVSVEYGTQLYSNGGGDERKAVSIEHGKFPIRELPTYAINYTMFDDRVKEMKSKDALRADTLNKERNLARAGDGTKTAEE